MEHDPNIGRQMHIAANNFRVFGFSQTLKDIVVYLLSAPPRERFDTVYNVDTAGYLPKTSDGVEDEEAVTHAIKYVPVAERVLHSIFEKLKAEIDVADFSFVDFGCGKGRAVVAATRLPFRAVLGVELFPALARAAQENVRRYRSSSMGASARTQDIRIVCENALECALPDSNLVVFMYRPFKGPIFQGVLDRLSEFARNQGRKVWIVYACPAEEKMLRDHPGFEMRFECQVISEEYSWNLWESRAEPARVSAHSLRGFDPAA